MGVCVAAETEAGRPSQAKDNAVCVCPGVCVCVCAEDRPYHHSKGYLSQNHNATAVEMPCSWADVVAHRETVAASLPMENKAEPCR